MKRTCLFALMISLLMWGCGPGAENENAIRHWLESCRESEISFGVSVMSQTEETAFSYKADCVRADGETVVTLTDPVNIAGVRFAADGESSRLEYDGAALLLGEPGGDLPPAMAVPVMMEALTEGFLRCTWQEEDYLLAQLETEEHTVTVWLKDECPVCVQIAVDGYTAAQLQIDRWQQKEA